MSLALSGADAGHLVAAAGLTYALGFERALRGAPAGDRLFALIGIGSGVVGIIAAHGAPNALAGVITGIGFIGGGLVFRQAVGRNNVVMGLNTAGAIFAAATIGLSLKTRTWQCPSSGTPGREPRNPRPSGRGVVKRKRYCHRASPTELADAGLAGAGGSDLELAEQGRRGGRDGVDRVAERLGVVPGGRAETADLPDVLQRGGTDFLVGHLLGVRRAEGLDASAHDPTVRPLGPGLRGWSPGQAEQGVIPPGWRWRVRAGPPGLR